MKKIFISLIFAAMTLLCGCSGKYESTIDLAVNNSRINISWSQAQEDLDFVMPVYAKGSWTIRVVAGGEWLTLDREKGEGNQYVGCKASANATGVPRAVRLEVSNSHKTIPVYVVTSSSVLSAANLADADLDNYLM